VRFLGISDGNMEEGSLRCDANISLRPVGEMKFGTRTEIKNINSFRFVERALEYEIARQLAVLKSGKLVEQMTMHFDSVAGVTRPLRSKEEASDYRYFPDPDLPPLVIEQAWIEDVRGSLPRLPEQIMHELSTVHGLSAYDAGVLTTDRSVVDYFYAVLDVCGNARAACNWLTSELFGALNKAGVELFASPIKAVDLGRLIQLLDSDAINGKIAKTVFEEMFATGGSPDEIIKDKGLQQITGDEQITAIVLEVFEKNAETFAKYVAGDERLHGFFVGETMKASAGKANPKKVNEILRKEAAKRADQMS